MIDLTDLFPGVVLVVHNGNINETYPPKCNCGCGISGVEWAKHNVKATYEETEEPWIADEYEYFEIVRSAADGDPELLVKGPWLVRHFSEPDKMPIGGIVAMWDGKQFGEYPSRDACLGDLRSGNRDWMSEGGGDFDCLEFFEIVGKPATGQRTGGFGGMFDSRGQREMFGYAVRPVDNFVTQDIRDSHP